MTAAKLRGFHSIGMIQASRGDEPRRRGRRAARLADGAAYRLMQVDGIPVFQPDSRLAPADAVLLNYVVNVIEDPAERRQTLQARVEPRPPHERLGTKFLGNLSLLGWHRV